MPTCDWLAKYYIVLAVCLYCRMVYLMNMFESAVFKALKGSLHPRGPRLRESICIRFYHFTEAQCESCSKKQQTMALYAYLSGKTR